MSDHGGHTISVGPVTVGETLHPCSCRICAAARERTALVDEVDRLRAENAALERKLNAALVDVVNMANESTEAAAPSGTPDDTLDLLRQAVAQAPRMTEARAVKRARDIAQGMGLQMDADRG